jgi:hypothetical protein
MKIHKKIQTNLLKMAVELKENTIKTNQKEVHEKINNKMRIIIEIII